MLSFVCVCDVSSYLLGTSILINNDTCTRCIYIYIRISDIIRSAHTYTHKTAAAVYYILAYISL